MTSEAPVKNPRLRRRRTGAAAAARIATAAIVSIAMVVAGQPRVAGAAEERDAVQGLIGDAVAEYDAGHFEEARALFRTAHNQSPSARTLRGIGMASFELRDYVEAVRTLVASLKERRRALTPEQRRHVDGLLARAETFVGRFTVRLSPSDASLFVDGKTADREPDGTLLLPLGGHRIVARCPTCTELERDLQVLGGESQELVIALERGTGQGSTGAAAVGETMPLATSGPDEPSVPEQRSAVPYLVGGAAVLAAGGAVAAALWWHDRGGELDACRAAGSRCQNEADVQRERNTAVGITLALAATAVTAGIFAAVLWSRRVPAKAQAVACVPIEKGVSCAMSF